MAINIVRRRIGCCDTGVVDNKLVRSCFRSKIALTKAFIVVTSCKNSPKFTTCIWSSAIIPYVRSKFRSDTYIGYILVLGSNRAINRIFRRIYLICTNRTPVGGSKRTRVDLHIWIKYIIYWIFQFSNASTVLKIGIY